MKNQSKNYLKIAAQSLTIIIITLLLLEAVGLYVYFHKHGVLYYTDARKGETIERKASASDRALDSKNILHPYFGFIFRPSLPISRVADRERVRKLLGGKVTEASWTNLTTNNHGFFSEFNYPRDTENQREFIIGIFGGSVGQWFALQGEDQLKNELQKHSFFRDRDIVVLNYSQGAFKQPQQLQALSYFLALGQKFDLIVNIDGFNEIALSRINHKKNIDTPMPSAQTLLPLLGLMGGAEDEILDKIHGLGASELKLRRYEQWESSTGSAGFRLILSMFHAIARNNYADKLKEAGSLGGSFDKTNLVYFAELPNTFSMSDSIREAMDLWFGTAVTMQEICNAKGILYLEVIQPNQYFSEKEFSTEEAALAISEDSSYGEAIRAGYQHLPDFILRMQQAGINVVSATSIFDEIKEQTYSDNCCHYNQRGNEILADMVAESIVTLIDNQRNAGQIQTE